MVSDVLRLIVGWGLPWLIGSASIVLLRTVRAESLERPGDAAWSIGCGWFVGAFVLTLWMRALSLVGIQFSFATIGVPIALAAVGLVFLAIRKTRASRGVYRAWRELRGADLVGGRRALWLAALAWLAFRSMLTLVEVMTTPLYPWDAWIQWATKARVWFELRRIVPFERDDAWFNAAGSAWFDAAPNYPATVPLWQVWSDVALGRWDDALMNLPWWLMAVAFMFVVYGALRHAQFGALSALLGTWLVSSLPLANVHVALAGYADLPMACYYAIAALALWRWTDERRVSDGALALFMAVACLTIKTPGIAWVTTLVPAVVLTLVPRWGPKILAGALIVAVGALLILARTDMTLLGYRLHLDFAPPWWGLFESLFLLGNWHLLWYAVVAVAIVGWRAAKEPAIAPLSVIVGSGLVFLFIVFAFTNARVWVTDQSTVNRAVLHIAPLLAIWMLIVFGAWIQRLRSAAVAPIPAA